MESEIASFYRDRSVFITGGTGFFGKILIEKLLRCCPGLKCVYVLIRTKAGQDAKSRLQDLLASRAFDNVRQNHPEFFKKVAPISGDITREELGISPQDLETLAKNVSVVFHSAATVRFDEPIKNAVELNIKGVKRMLSVCKKLENLEVLVHVSTAYVNSMRSELNETIYRPLCDADKLVVTLDWLDDSTANTITKSLLHGSPNTYTFTKSLGETIINSEANEVHFKVVIVRPSIVTASWKEPLPGWVDTINGPTGLFAGSAAGIFRTMYCHTQMAVDIIPGEFPVNLMIASAWDAVTNTVSKQPMNPTVFLASTGQNPVTWAQCEKIIYPLMFEYPFSRAIWPPGGSFKSNYFHHKLDQALYHFAPAYAMDMLIRLCGKKPFMVRLHRKAAKAMNCLQFYTIREWRTRCDNTNELVERMSLTDRAMFNFDSRTIDWEDYLCAYYLGVRKFILKDEPHTLPAAKSHMRNLILIQFGFRVTLAVLVARAIIRRSETARSVWHLFLSTAAKYFVAATNKIF